MVQCEHRCSGAFLDRREATQLVEEVKDEDDPVLLHRGLCVWERRQREAVSIGVQIKSSGPCCGHGEAPLGPWVWFLRTKRGSVGTVRDNHDLAVHRTVEQLTPSSRPLRKVATVSGDLPLASLA